MCDVDRAAVSRPRRRTPALLPLAIAGGRTRTQGSTTRRPSRTSRPMPSNGPGASGEQARAPESVAPGPVVRCAMPSTARSAVLGPGTTETEIPPRPSRRSAADVHRVADSSHQCRSAARRPHGILFAANDTRFETDESGSVRPSLFRTPIRKRTPMRTD